MYRKFVLALRCISYLIQPGVRTHLAAADEHIPEHVAVRLSWHPRYGRIWRESAAAKVSIMHRSRDPCLT